MKRSIFIAFIILAAVVGWIGSGQFSNNVVAQDDNSVTSTETETSDSQDTENNDNEEFTFSVETKVFTSNLIDQSIIDKEQELVTEELKNSGKPEEIAKKISIGKMNKFKEENALLTQAWVMEPKKKVKEILEELSIADLKISEFYRIKIGE